MWASIHDVFSFSSVRNLSLRAPQPVFHLVCTIEPNQLPKLVRVRPTPLAVLPAPWIHPPMRNGWRLSYDELDLAGSLKSGQSSTLHFPSELTMTSIYCTNLLLRSVRP